MLKDLDLMFKTVSPLDAANSPVVSFVSNSIHAGTRQATYEGSRPVYDEVRHLVYFAADKAAGGVTYNVFFEITRDMLWRIIYHCHD